MKNHRHFVDAPKAAGGFSLVELMLALALGLIVVTGIVQLFVSNSQTYQVLNGQARLQESGRFALDFVSRAARSAGYFGCAMERQNLVKGLRGNWAVMPEFNVMRSVQGYDASGGGWNPPLTTLPTTTNAFIPANGIDPANVTPGTDVLVLRAMQRPGQRLTQVLQPTGDPVITAPGNDPGFDTNDVVMVANCEQGAVFRVTGMLNVSPNEVQLLHATSGAGGIYENASTIDSPTGSIAFTLSFLGRSYGAETNVGRVETTVFYVAEGAGLDNQGNPPLALWRKVGTAAPVELVQGVEDFQVLYGIDTTLNDDTPNANQYVTYDNVPLPASPNDPSPVVALRVSVTVNSVDGVVDGNVLRRTFTKTILLRNANAEA